MPPAIDLKTAPSTLTRARVRLETPRADHAPAFAESLRASLPGFTYLSWGARATQDGWALRFCVDDAHSVAAGEDLVFHAFEIDTGAYVGRLDVHTIDAENARAELGYVGDVRRAGRGLMREAALAVIDLCFALGFERVEAMSDARNARALRFAESLGMQREGVLRRHERDPQGQMCDMVIYAALKR